MWIAAVEHLCLAGLEAAYSNTTWREVVRRATIAITRAETAIRFCVELSESSLAALMLSEMFAASPARIDGREESVVVVDMIAAMARLCVEAGKSKEGF